MSAWFPCFLDIEASGFGPDSYPLAVAWTDGSSTIHRMLIDPASVPGWTWWDPVAERVHGLSRKRLAQEGLPAATVADAIARDLTGCRVFTDAPEFDRTWLQRLFTAVGQPLPCEFDHADELLLGALQRPYEMAWQAQNRLEALKAELATTRTERHDAGYDVGWLILLWRRANGEVARMAHGEGPLPECTPTGSFVRARRGQPPVGAAG